MTYRHVSILSLVLVVGLCWAREATAASLQLVKSPVLPVDAATRTGSTTLYVRNTSQQPVPVLISVGDVTSTTTGRVIDAQVTLSAPEETKGSLVFKPTAQADEILAIKVSVANAWEVGEATAPILDHGAKIGTLRLTNFRPPFNVHLDPADSTLAFRYPTKDDEGAAQQGFILKNEDAVTYPIHWRLAIGSQTAEGTLQLPPNGSQPVSFKPPEGWFSSWAKGLFKQDVRAGRLSLSFAPAGRGDDPSLPARTVDVKARLTDRSPGLQQILGSAVLLLILALGGIVSLLLNHGIPNRLKRLNLRDRFNEIAERTRGISSRIESQLRVQLRVERRNLSEELRVSWALSPEFIDTFDRLNRGLDSLSRRIDLLKQIDELYDRLEASTTSAFVPTLLDQVIAKLNEAKEKLGRADITEPELQASQALITESAILLKKHGVFDPSLAQNLALRLESMAKEFAIGGALSKTATLARLAPKFTNLLARTQGVIGNPAAIDVHNYAQMDSDLARLQILAEYIRLFEDASPSGQKRLTDLVDGTSREDLFVYELSQNSWQGLLWSRILVRQVREKIYKKDIIDAIEKGDFSIQFAPAFVYAYEEVKFQVRFNKSWLNSAAALEKLGCRWDFGHLGLVENGWRACHYFPDAGKQLVTVTFETEAGQPIQDAKGKPAGTTRVITIAPRTRTSWFGDRTQLEMARLAVVLVAAVLGLLAGAQEQLQKLDVFPGLVAVFLIGFGADTLKNLLVRSQN